jgi:ankyrin repeat protein
MKIKLFSFHFAFLFLFFTQTNGICNHRCILNQHLDCLKLLLSHGASPNPPLPKLSTHTKRTSLRLETPLELARRAPTINGENLFEQAILEAMVRQESYDNGKKRNLEEVK